MDRRRTAWLAAVPLLAAAGALVLGAACAAAAAVFVTPYADDAELSFSAAGQALLGVPLGDLEEPLRLLPVAVGVVMAELAWVVGLGVGVQRLLPRRRRLVPAAAAVLLAALGGWVALGALAVETQARDITVGSAAGAVVFAAVAAGLLVLPLAGRRWPLAPRPLPKPQPAPTPRPAGQH